MRNLLHDDSLFLLLRGYDFAERIWERVSPGSRAAPMRLLGDDALLVRGAEGVRLFYDETAIARQGAMPRIVQETLFGHGSVHGLDGDQQHHRKSAFVAAAYEDAQAARLAPLLEQEWQRELTAWIGGGRRSAYECRTAEQHPSDGRRRPLHRLRRPSSAHSSAVAGPYR
ncbi:hypothetical protein [Microbacterium sp. GXF0217]